MSPEPSQDPAAPLVRRLLLHALEPRRHAHLPLPVLLPARQLLPVRVQHDEGRQAAGPLLVLDADLARRGALEVRERLRPEGRVRARPAADGVVRAVVARRRGALAAGAEADGREAPLASLRVRLPADDGEPVDGAALVRVEAQAGEAVERLGAPLLVQRAEEAVSAPVQPGGRHGQAVADQGREFEVLVPGPQPDLGHFLRGEEAVVGVAAHEVGLFADREAVVPDLGGMSVHRFNAQGASVSNGFHAPASFS